MKHFLRRLAPFVLFILLLEVAIPIFADPYNVFHWKQLRDNGVEPNSNFIKMKYILNNPEKFDSFLFGSSRTSFIDVERIPEGKWYNMSYSEGLPAEHLENLREMIDHDIIPKNVMIGVDNISCFVDPSIHEEQFYRIPYPRSNPLSFYANYFSIKGVIRSLDVTLKYKPQDPDFVERYYQSGSNSREESKKAGKWKNDAPYWDDYYTDRLGDTIFELRVIAELCKEYDIRLIVFTNPIYYKTYQQSKNYGYDQFLGWIAGSSEYYNFSGINDVTTNRMNYLESSHYTMEVGDRIIDRIFNDKRDETLESQGFGFYVTEDNIEEFEEALANH